MSKFSLMVGDVISGSEKIQSGFLPLIILRIMAIIAMNSSIWMICPALYAK